jgi:hypothetical protein
LVLYFDNLESLLVGPADDVDAGAFGHWAEEALETIWKNADQLARESKQFYLIASCRYRNDCFRKSILPLTPLPADALFRLTEWFPGLQRLTTATRARLVNRLDGHPRAVEYTNDLIEDALAKWNDINGEWKVSMPPSSEEIEREWREIVEPCLPQVAEKLNDNLLLQALWDRVLDERARRFLYRMTVLRQPVEWSLLEFMGEPEEPAGVANETAQRLRDTSLLEHIELMVRISKDQVGRCVRFTLHPATERFVRSVFDDSPEIRLSAHRRLGDHLEVEAVASPYIETDIEAGYHLFQAGEYARSMQLLGAASQWL